MTAASPMSSRRTSLASVSATSSPASAAGGEPCASPAGPTTDLFGRALVPVSPSASPAEAVAPTTSATCGPSSTGSSASAALQSSLASRLRERLGSAGSTECSLIWKEAVTPAGRRLCRLAVSARRTEGNGSGLWRSPKAGEGMGRYSQVNGKRYPALWDQAKEAVALWPTPTSLAPAKDGNNEAGNSAGLVAIRKHALWSTPRASDGEKGGPNQSFGAGGSPLPAQAAQTLWPTMRAGSGACRPVKWPPRDPKGRLEDAAATALWATPQTRAKGGGDYSDPAKAAARIKSGHQVNLQDEVLALWATPTARDHKSPLASAETHARNARPLSEQAGAASGMTPSGSPERTASPGALDPAFVCWLMGYPPEWLSCAPSATRSSRKSRRSS